MSRLPCLVAFLLFAMTTPDIGIAQELSSEEQRLVEYIDAHLEEAFAFLEKTVNINSGTMNHEGVREVGQLYHAEFDAIGLNSRWVSLPDSVNRAGHLFAERTGTRGQRLLLIGHLDTVFEKNSPFQQFERTGDGAKGPGTEDMKGGNLVLLYALKALHAMGALDDMGVIVALTGDEEAPGRPVSVSREALIEAAQRSDIALGFEGGSDEGRAAVVARRGSSGWTLRVTGTRGHSSQVFGEALGAGAVFEAARILNGFYERVRGEEYLTFNPGIILGGTDVEFDRPNATGSAFGKTNVVAQTVTVNGGLRFITEDQKNRARDAMREVVAEHLPGTSAEITFSDGYPAMPPSDGNHAVLEVLQGVSAALNDGGVRAVDPGRRGAADISFVAPYISGIDGLGPVGADGHTIHETVDLDSFAMVIKRAALLMYRLTRDPQV